MKVLKFGGTSVGSPERMEEIIPIIQREDRAIIVLSAFSGVTNALVNISELTTQKNISEALNSVKQLESKFITYATQLFKQEPSFTQANQLIESRIKLISQLVQSNDNSGHEKTLLAQGELISTGFFQIYLQEKGLNSALINALNFMRTTAHEEPDEAFISTALIQELAQHKEAQFFITQGFICKNISGSIDNLKRGGSDYTATLIGSAIHAEEIQIWTDIDGMHNNDPRIVEDTSPITHLSFEEAGELAYFGAKILHPTSVVPAIKAEVPIWLKNTMNPDAEGTLISHKSIDKHVKAIAAKDGITAIKIKSDRMLQAHGFLKKVFEIFENHQTSIDMITTSEVAISLTIDDRTKLQEIRTDLAKLGQVEIDENQSIVCVVGNFIAESKGLAHHILKSFLNIPVRMISYGGSRHNISVLINSEFKEEALVSLHHELFQETQYA